MVKFQIVQPEAAVLIINLVADPLDNDDRQNLERLIKEKLGPVEIKINNVTDIPKDGSGKFRAVISRIESSI